MIFSSLTLTKKSTILFLFQIAVVMLMFLFLPLRVGANACGYEYDPVCGQTTGACANTLCLFNQRTYANDCLRKEAGAIFLYKGACTTKTKLKNENYPNQTAEQVFEKEASKETQETNVDKMRNLIMLKVKTKQTLLDQLTYLKTFTKRLQAQYKVTSSEQIRKEYEQLFPLLEKKIAELEEQKEQETSRTLPVGEEKATVSNVLYQLGSYENLVVNVPRECALLQTGKTISLTCKTVSITFWDTKEQTQVKKNEDATKNAQENQQSTQLRQSSLPTLTLSGNIQVWSGTDKFLLFQKYVRETLCPKPTGGMRIVTYKILEEKKTHTNATQASIFTVCQEWKKVNKKLVSSQPFVIPVKITFAEVDAKWYLLDPIAILPGITYTQVIQQQFSPAIQEIFMGKKPNVYNDLLSMLLEEGKKVAEEIVK